MMDKVTNSRYFHVLFSLLIILMITSPSGAAFQNLSEGMEAPVVSGVDLLSGKKISIADWANDGTTIIVFWATWSERSLTELSHLAQMYVRYDDKPLHFIAVNVEGKEITKELKEEIIQQMNELNISFASIIDYGMEYFDKFGVIAVPSTAIIDASGILRYGPAGYSYTVQDKLIDSIEALPGIKKNEAPTVAKSKFAELPGNSTHFGLAMLLSNKPLLCRPLD